MLAFKDELIKKIKQEAKDLIKIDSNFEEKYDDFIEDFDKIIEDLEDRMFIKKYKIVYWLEDQKDLYFEYFNSVENFLSIVRNTLMREEGFVSLIFDWKGQNVGELAYYPYD